jgi:hypothetical protein
MAKQPSKSAHADASAGPSAAAPWRQPCKRALRIHDASAVRVAWDHVHATKGLTPDGRKEERRRIIGCAQELESTRKDEDAGKLKLPIVLNAMALNIATDDGHPNKIPFSSALTRIDEPSDRSLEGRAGISSRFLLKPQRRLCKLGSVWLSITNRTSNEKAKSVRWRHHRTHETWDLLRRAPRIRRKARPHFSGYE